MPSEATPAPEKLKLLIVEDDPGLQKQLKWSLEAYEVIVAGDRESAINEMRRHEPAVVLQDLGLPPDAEGVSEGLATMRDLLALAPHTKIIVVTGNDDRDNAIRAVAQGAYDFYPKPIDTDVLALLLQRAYRMHALEDENRRLRVRGGSSPIVGVIAVSDSMRRVCRMIEKVAPTNATTLLIGESGTGKEVLARALHELSPRSKKPFIAINCAAIPEALLESELFGHEKGAFTGAIKQTQGKVEYANGGTLFLDEIGDMPIALQSKMLRFLQGRVFERVGGRDTIGVDVRVIAATNRDLPARIKEQQFREDLFYRINEVTIQIPPLREREGDAVVIAQKVLGERAREHGRQLRGFTPDALAAINGWGWPGNIRELENKVNGAVIMAEANHVTAADLGIAANGESTDFLNLRNVRQRAEGEAVRRALALASGNVTRAAELLGVTRPTLYDLMSRHDARDGG